MTSKIAPSADARPVLVIAGPTGGGKSALALAAAERFDGVVINADSMQVYRRLRILTARPSPADEARAPHKLYGWLEPDDICSAGRWRQAALDEIQAAHAAGRLPIVVGGTGFYLEALMRGLPAAPNIPDAVRDAARADVAADPQAVHRALATADPETAARIRPSDPQRLARALEVWRAAGAPPSEALARRIGPPPGLAFQLRVLLPERETLYRRIDRRVVAMADAGAMAEAAAFQALGVDPNLPAAKAVGLREFAEAAVGDILLQDAINATAQASRRYAKRQMTWLRGRLGDAERIELELSSQNIADIVHSLPKTALTLA